MDELQTAPARGHMPFCVRIADAGVDDICDIAAVADFLQNSAAGHAADLGFHNDVLAAEGVAWVLVREYIAMDRYPAIGEPVTVTTWPASLTRTRARRDFVLTGRDGERLGVATSVWVTIDVASRRIAPIPDIVAAAYPDTPDHSVELPAGKVPRLGDDARQRTARILTRRSDLDSNGHVNNVHYVEWAMEARPEELPARPLTCDITFRAEAGAGQMLLSHAGRVDGRVLHSLVREEDGVEVARLATTWAQESGE